jgi:isochorismate hydrolase
MTRPSSNVAKAEPSGGRLGLEKYWRPKLAQSATGAFVVDALFPENDGVCLDYRAFDGTPVRTHFTFNEAGKIRHTACGAIKQAA